MRQPDRDPGSEAFAEHRNFGRRRGGMGEIEGGARVGPQPGVARGSGRGPVAAVIDAEHAEPMIAEIAEQPGSVVRQNQVFSNKIDDDPVPRLRRLPPAVEPLAVFGRDMDLGDACQPGGRGRRTGALHRGEDVGALVRDEIRADPRVRAAGEQTYGQERVPEAFRDGPPAEHRPPPVRRAKRRYGARPPATEPVLSGAVQAASAASARSRFAPNQVSVCPAPSTSIIVLGSRAAA